MNTKTGKKKGILIFIIIILIISVSGLFYLKNQFLSADEIISMHINCYKTSGEPVMEDFYVFFIENYQLTDDEFRPVFFDFFNDYFDLQPVPDAKEISPELIVEYEKEYTEFFYRFDDYYAKRMQPGQSKLIAHYLLEGDTKDLMNNYPNVEIGSGTFQAGGLSNINPDSSALFLPEIKELNLNCFAISTDFQVDSYKNALIFGVGDSCKFLSAHINQQGQFEVRSHNKTILTGVNTYKPNEMFRVFVSYRAESSECCLYVDNQFCGKTTVNINTKCANNEADRKIGFCQRPNENCFVGKIRNLRVFSE